MGVVVKFARRAANDDARRPDGRVRWPAMLVRRAAAAAVYVARLLALAAVVVVGAVVGGVCVLTRWPLLLAALAGLLFARTNPATWYLVAATVTAWFLPVFLPLLVDLVGGKPAGPAVESKA